MAMLKTLVRKAGGCRQIKDYLARDGRAQTFDSSMATLSAQDWDVVMDETRRAWGKDVGRKYYHFVISPDPRDKAGVEQVRSLACEWAAERYAGKEWVVETHVDNGIPHAHVVVNSVDPCDGRKIQISGSDAALDTATLQAMCRNRGLTPISEHGISQDDDGVWHAATDRSSRGDWEQDRPREPRAAARHDTDGQRRARRSGAALWTDKMHADIEEAIAGCRTWRGLEASLARIGYRTAVNRRGVLTFYPPEGTGHPIKGYKLDDSYTVEGLRARLAPRLDGRRLAGLADASLVPEALLPPRTLADIVEGRCTRARRRGASEASLAATVDALALIRERGYRSLADMAREREEIERRVDALERELDDAELALSQLAEAARRLSKLEERPDRATRAADEEWLRARGLDPLTETAEALSARRESLAARASGISARASAAASDAGRLAAAMSALSDAPLGIGAVRVARRNARERSWRASSVQMLTLDQAKMLSQAYGRRRDEILRAIGEGAFDAVRLAEIERHYERDCLAAARRRDVGSRRNAGEKDEDGSRGEDVLIERRPDEDRRMRRQ